MKKKTILGGSILLLSLLCGWVFAACPSADLTGDCYVDMEDFAEFASQWLTGYHIPDDFIKLTGGTFDMGDSNDGSSDALPVHSVQLDSFYICKYELTNGEYCAYLNSAYQGGLIAVIDDVVYKAGSGTTYPYCNTHSVSNTSQIDCNDGVFSVRTKGGRDMSDDPMVEVSWYGAAAYCNWRSLQEGKELCYNLSAWECDFSKKGYRLPTEAEWEYAARGGVPNLRFPWGDTITHGQANYYSDTDYFYDVSPTRGYHPTWNDGIFPYTSPSTYGVDNFYHLKNVAGNVAEWAYDWYSPTYYSITPYPHVNPTGPLTGENRVMRGGGWSYYAPSCRVAARDGHPPYVRFNGCGLRLVLPPE